MEKGHGAPNFFITLSCCEHYWPDIIRLLKERLIAAGQDASACYMGSPKLSQILNDYAIVVQEYFQKRVEMWLKTVGKKVFDIEHYWVRYEFAPGRGQIHAHLLAITKDKTIIKLCHLDKQISDTQRDKRLSEWAEAKLGLTASFDPAYENIEIEPNQSPCSVRFSDINEDPQSQHEDKQRLLKYCQMHKCNGFCLRPDKHKRYG